MPERPISPHGRPEEVVVDTALRPRTLAEMIGQDRLRENLSILIQAARARGEALDHVLLYGPPGLGKTSLAHVISNEMGTGLKVTAGPAVERAGDLAAILTNLRQGDILFIDEVHRLGRAVEEVLYPAMEDFALDIVIGKGPSARNIRLKLPRFTIIGATTRLALMTAPLRARFGAVYRFDFYEVEAIEKIVQRAADLLHVPITPEPRRHRRDWPARAGHAPRGVAHAPSGARLCAGQGGGDHHGRGCPRGAGADGGG
jgi:Holliday junction DNA helicase RuvB